MVPASVSQAWEKLSENHKAAITRACAKKQPAIFMRWVDAARLKNFRQDSLVNRKGGAAPRLDAVLFKAEEGQLAMDILVSYFTELAPAINDECLALLEQAGEIDGDGKLKIYAQIAHQHQKSPYIRLYLTTLVWVEEFDEAALATVDALTTELAATTEG